MSDPSFPLVSASTDLPSPASLAPEAPRKRRVRRLTKAALKRARKRTAAVVRRIYGQPVERRTSSPDLAGLRVGRLVVQARTDERRGHQVMWECLCDCGERTRVRTTHLVHESIRSCGCLRSEWWKAKAVERGSGEQAEKWPRVGGWALRHHPLYRVWGGMVRRCENTDERGYSYYGGRGIAVCEEWRRDPYAFVVWGIMNGWTLGRHLTVDRIDPGLDYAPENCQMITREENSSRAAVAMWESGMDRYSRARDRASDDVDKEIRNAARRGTRNVAIQVQLWTDETVENVVQQLQSDGFKAKTMGQTLWVDW